MSRFSDRVASALEHRPAFDQAFAAWVAAVRDRVGILFQDVVVAGIRDGYPYRPLVFRPFGGGVVEVEIVGDPGAAGPPVVRVAWWEEDTGYGSELPTLIACSGDDPEYERLQRQALQRRSFAFHEPRAARFLAALGWVLDL